MEQTTKVAAFEPTREDLELAKVLYALSDPVRLRMVAELHRLGEVPCGTVAAELPKSTRSHHLKVLREAGITRTRFEGTERRTRLRYDCLEARFPGLLRSVLSSAPHRDPDGSET
ncbi:MAG TPA: metalloregulator ArsR/SmtB family transcription factor [Candidatus Aquilonibacter sp.]